ncbi:TPA: guanosine 5'-monophosphate oxidoreductase [Streptococcus suis]|nr:guanosine 5'-monophosphate oxidoreductase [Streptococcus suis]NQJ76802.1 guanosine 5'-monophosphate oxidoreductase [Streptococcus suis]HEM6339013.1 guanosine 5'-monophosphate oxidoreductase [Streptococcus suis]
MVHYLVTDNSKISPNVLLENLSNRTLKQLAGEDFLLFPPNVNQSSDLRAEQSIFELRNGQWWTCNLVGFLAGQGESMTIRSRFSLDDGDDFFLQYMLETVLHYNVTKHQLNSQRNQSFYDLLVFLFPYYLNKAISKGFYKEYVRNNYNDSHLRGWIDISRHIQQNVLFTGRIAYQTREFSFDNPVNQLIRHTIEKICHHQAFILDTEPTIREHVQIIRQLTPSYSLMDRETVLLRNINSPLRHGYYEEYGHLQNLCIRILQEEKIHFGNQDQNINGFLIDIAWLWEEFIGNVTNWEHYGRGSNLKTLHLFKNPVHSPRYPDFVYQGIPIDTKYKRILDSRNDYNQLTTYVHILQAKQGGFIQPSTKKSGLEEIGELSGLGGKLFSYYFQIPQAYTGYDDFCQQMKNEEKRMLEKINL